MSLVSNLSWASIGLLNLYYVYMVLECIMISHEYPYNALQSLSQSDILYVCITAFLSDILFL